MNTADAFNSGASPSDDRPCKDQFWKIGRSESLIIESHDLFQGNVVIQIRHGDEIYTLRQTRLGKLILNK
jgi:hemin uptake protein HemP|tara:strand:+ start:243 stop:452 length:210 start_codon:yes stop_codon:yes gene_type:complete